MPRDPAEAPAPAASEPDRWLRVAFARADRYRRIGLGDYALATLAELARALEERGLERHVVRVLRKITQLSPDLVVHRLRLAKALSRADDVDGAATELGIAASQLVALGRREDALAVIERLLHHRPDPSFARLGAELHLSKKTRHDALHALKKLRLCVRQGARDVETLRLVARAFSVLGDEERAMAVDREIAALEGDAGADA